MKKFIYMYLLIITLILTGCKGKVDVDKLSIASAIGIDKSEQGYKVSAQVVNPIALSKNGGGDSLQPITVHSEEAPTVSEALRKLSIKYPSFVFTAHFDILFIGEDLAKEGILPPIIYFYTDNLSRHSFIVALVKGATAEDVLKIKTPLSKIPSSELYSMIKNTGSILGVSTAYYLDEILSKIKSTGSELALSTIEIEGDKKEGSENKNVESIDVKTIVKFSNLGVFKGDKLVGYLNLDEAKGYTHVNNKVMGTINSVVIKNDVKVAFEIYQTGIKIKPDIKENTHEFNINYEVTGRLSSISTGQVSVNKNEIKQIENAVSEDIKSLMEKSIAKSKELNSDIFGFGQIIHKKDLKYWKSIKDKYDEIYKDTKISINVEVTLDSKAY